MWHLDAARTFDSLLTSCIFLYTCSSQRASSWLHSLEVPMSCEVDSVDSVDVQAPMDSKPLSSQWQSNLKNVVSTGPRNGYLRSHASPTDSSNFMVYQVISLIPTCANAEKQLVAQCMQTFGNLLMQFPHCEVKDKGWSICHHFLGDMISLISFWKRYSTWVRPSAGPQLQLSATGGHNSMMMSWGGEHYELHADSVRIKVPKEHCK